MNATITIGTWTYLAGDCATFKQLDQWGLDGTHELRGDPHNPKLLFNTYTTAEHHRFCISALFSYQPDTGFTFTLGLVSLRDGTSTQTAKSVTDLVELVDRGEASFVALAPAVFAGQSELDGVAAELRKGGPK